MKCIKVCKLENGRCIGCLRTIEEIKAAYKKVLDSQAKNGYNESSRTEI